MVANIIKDLCLSTPLSSVTVITDESPSCNQVLPDDLSAPEVYCLTSTLIFTKKLKGIAALQQTKKEISNVVGGREVA